MYVQLLNQQFDQVRALKCDNFNGTYVKGFPISKTQLQLKILINISLRKTKIFCFIS